MYLPAGAEVALRRALGQPIEVARAAVSTAADLSERAVEEHLFQHWKDTPFAEIGIELSSVGRFGLAGRQVVTPVSNIDLLGYQPVLKKWWVIELKRGVTADAAVGQVSRYLGWVAADRGPRGETAVGVVLTDRVDAKLRYAVAANPLLSLWLYDEAIRLRRDEP